MGGVSRRTMLTSAGAAGVSVAATSPAAAEQAVAEPGRADFPACDWTEAELVDRRRVLKAGFTEDEADCWLLVARAGGKFFDLPFMHPSINPEVAEAIHVLQDKLLMRPTYRKYREGAGDESPASYR